MTEISFGANKLLFVLSVTLAYVAIVLRAEAVPKCPFKGEPKKHEAFSEEDKKAIVEQHNDYRKQILEGKIEELYEGWSMFCLDKNESFSFCRPKAKTMPELTWDDKLEDEAMRSVDILSGFLVF